MCITLRCLSRAMLLLDPAQLPAREREFCLTPTFQARFAEVKSALSPNSLSRGRGPTLNGVRVRNPAPGDASTYPSRSRAYAHARRKLQGAASRPDLAPSLRHATIAEVAPFAAKWHYTAWQSAPAAPARMT
jgi:hypothetical protein